MQNTTQNRLIGVSHFFLSIGIFLLSLMVMYSLSKGLVYGIFDYTAEELMAFSPENLSYKQGLALKFVQVFTGLSFIAAGLLCALTFKVRFTEFAGLKNPFTWKNLLLSLGILVCGMPIVDALVQVNQQLQLPESLASFFQEMEDSSNDTYAAFLKHNTGVDLLINLLVMAILAAVGEEIFFRGILMRVVTNWTNNIHLGIVVSSLLFAIIHFQPYKVVPMIFLAMLFGYLYYRTSSLWVPIILHSLNNSLVVLADFGQKQNMQWAIADESYSMPLYYVVVGVIGLVGLGYYLWKNTYHTDFSYD